MPLRWDRGYSAADGHRCLCLGNTGVFAGPFCTAGGRLAASSAEGGISLPGSDLKCYRDPSLGAFLLLLLQLAL